VTAQGILFDLSSVPSPVSAFPNDALAIGIEHPLDVVVQCSHDPNAREQTNG
jgi:hypothetical protein